MNNKQTTQKCVAVVVNVALALACSVRGADVTWSNTSGGLFEVGGNWVGGSAPGTNDAAKFTADASYTVTFGGTVTNGHAYFYAPGGTVTLDIGAGNLYFLNNGSGMGTLRIQNTAGGSACAAIVSGRVSVNSHIYVGDQSTYNGNKLTVANHGTYLETRVYDINSGMSGSFNELLVTNGATVAPYRTAYAGSSVGSNNLITVTGADSLLRPLTANVVAGEKGDNNRIVVTDGASVVAPQGALIAGNQDGADNNSIYLLAGTHSVFSNGSSYVGNSGAGNTMIVSNATYYNHYNLVVGSSSSSNALEVSGGAVMTDRTHLYIGNTASAQNNTVVIRDSGTVFRTTAYDLNSGNYGSYNTLTIRNGAQAVACRSAYAGTTGGSSYNQIIVSGEGSVLRSEGLNSANYSVAVGVNGTNNVLRLEDGGVFVCSNTVEFSVGVNASAQGNIADIGSGCFVTNGGYLYVGKYGRGNVLTVSNSIFCVGGYSYVGYSGCENALTVQDGATYLENGHLYLGYNADGLSNTVTVTGSGSTLNNTKFDLDVGRAGSYNLLDISDGASMEIMRNSYIGHLNTASNNTLRVAGGSFACVQSGVGNVIFSNACTLAVCGSNSVVRARTLRLEGGSTLDVEVGADGFTPVDVIGWTYFDDTTRLTVDARAFQRAGGGTVTLMTYGYKSQDILSENIALLPEGSSVNQNDGKSITLHVPGFNGTVISIR